MIVNLISFLNSQDKVEVFHLYYFQGLLNKNIDKFDELLVSIDVFREINVKIAFVAENFAKGGGGKGDPLAAKKCIFFFRKEAGRFESCKRFLFLSFIKLGNHSMTVLLWYLSKSVFFLQIPVHSI